MIFDNHLDHWIEQAPEWNSYAPTWLNQDSFYGSLPPNFSLMQPPV